jgi:hypothetical protein
VNVALSAKQRGVRRGMIFGVCASFLLISAGSALNPFGFAANLTLSQRISVALESAVLLAMCLAVAVGRLAKHRFFSPEDIDGGGLHAGSERARLLQSLLQNTLEQAVLAVLVYSAWAISMPASALSVVPLAAMAFAVGRILFFMSYSKGAPARALGFTLAFYPSVGMLLCVVVRQLWTLSQVGSR